MIMSAQSSTKNNSTNSNPPIIARSNPLSAGFCLGDAQPKPAVPVSEWLEDFIKSLGDGSTASGTKQERFRDFVNFIYSKWLGGFFRFYNSQDILDGIRECCLMVNGVDAEEFISFLISSKTSLSFLPWDKTPATYKKLWRREEKKGEKLDTRLLLDDGVCEEDYRRWKNSLKVCRYCGSPAEIRKNCCNKKRCVLKFLKENYLSAGSCLEDK